MFNLSQFINENSTVHFKIKEMPDNVCRTIIYVGETNIGKVDATINGHNADITYIHINEMYRNNGYATILLKKFCTHLITEHGITEFKMNVKSGGNKETSMFRKLLTSIGFSINTYGTNKASFSLNI